MGEGKQPGEALRSFAKVVLPAVVVVGRTSCDLLSVELLTSLTVSDEKQTAGQWTTRQRPHPGSPTHFTSPRPGGLPRPTPTPQSSDFKRSLFTASNRLFASKFKFYTLKLTSKVSMKMFFHKFLGNLFIKYLTMCQVLS